MSLVSKFLVGVVLSLMAAMGLQTWRLAMAHSENAVLEANNASLVAGLESSTKAYQELQRVSDARVSSLIERGKAREKTIKHLSEKKSDLAEVSTDKCLDDPLPIAISKLLQAKSYNSGSTSEGLPAGGTATAVPVHRF